MKLPTFMRFVTPSTVLMTVLLAAPLMMTAVLSLRQCQPEFEVRNVELSTPFGSELVLMQMAKLGLDLLPTQRCDFAGALYFRSLLGWQGEGASSGSTQSLSQALAFTLRYVGLTTPIVLGLGLLLAQGTSRLPRSLRMVCITCSMIPFVLTPVVGALLFKWIFRDGGLIPGLLVPFGVDLHWMAQPWTAEAVVVAYGVWQSTPFAFVVFYAGLMALPSDPIEAAMVDGATPWQIFRLVVVPQLMPLVLFVTLIHVMDAYRVFEPVLVLTQGAFSVSVQYLAYQILLIEQNVHKASAASVLTIIGVLILLIPMILKTWAEHRQGAPR